MALPSARRVVAAIVVAAVPVATAVAADPPVCTTANGVTICLAAPASNATLSGQIHVTATATGATISRVNFRIGSEYLLSDTSRPYEFTFDSSLLVDGATQLRAQAINGAVSATPLAEVAIPVTLVNGTTSPPAPPTGFVPRTAAPAQPGGAVVTAVTGDGPDGGAVTGRVAAVVASWAPQLALYVGDVYEGGSTSEFTNWWDAVGTPPWGSLRSITNPVVGNHEYEAEQLSGRPPAPIGYRRYWNSPPDWYSVDVNGWHLIALNSNCEQRVSCLPGSPQHTWLAADLAANTQGCIAAFYHHPRWTTAPNPEDTAVDPLWRLLANAGADLVFQGHVHNYQRFVPLDAAGQPSSSGVTSFVVGTGGHGLFEGGSPADARLAALSSAPGALRLELKPGSARWRYVSMFDSTLDFGAVSCSSDTTAPTAPADLTATRRGSTAVDLAWPDATDDRAVAGYDIFRNGAKVATTWTTSYADRGLAASATYTYGVAARDGAGNVSPVVARTVATGPAPATATFAPTADTRVSASAPATNYGSSIDLQVDAAPTVRSYLRFNVSGISGTVESARLRIYSRVASHRGVDAFAVPSTTWVETVVTDATAPVMAGPSAGSSGSIAAGPGYFDLDVTPLVAGNGEVTIGLATLSITALTLASRESATPPSLVVTYAPPADQGPPSGPATLTATAQSATSVALSWPAATDDVGVTGYRIYRGAALLQTVAATALATVDTSAAASTTYTYAVKAIDAAGNESTGATATVTTPATGVSTTRTFAAAADAYVAADFPTTNFGTTADLRADASPTTRSYLMFSVTGLTGTVTAATLRVYEGAPTHAGLSLYGVASTTWTETGITFQNAPVLAATATSGSGPIAGGPRYLDLPITPLVTGNGTVAVALQTTSTARLTLHSRTGANPPQLVVTTFTASGGDTTPPSGPTTLAATAQGATSALLSWPAASDAVGVTGYRVYRNGAVVGTPDQATLSFVDSGLTPSTTYAYRVTAVDAAGNESAGATASATTSGGTQVTTTFAADADAFVAADTPTTNFGTTADLRADATPATRSYLRFTLTGLAGTVVSAKLRIRENAPSHAGVDVYGVADSSWTETGITYANAPAVASSVAGSSGAFADGPRYLEIPLAALVTGNGTVSLAVTTTSGTRLTLQSRTGANPPQLVVTTAS